MIIKIEDLPLGQKISRLHVDITFQDGDINITSKIVPVVSSEPDSDVSAPKLQESFDIPPEMLDNEF